MNKPTVMVARWTKIVAPAMGGLMGRMDVHHRLFLRGMRIALLAQCIVLAASA